VSACSDISPGGVRTHRMRQQARTSAISGPSGTPLETGDDTPGPSGTSQVTADAEGVNSSNGMQHSAPAPTPLTRSMQQHTGTDVSAGPKGAPLVSTDAEGVIGSSSMQQSAPAHTHAASTPAPGTSPARAHERQLDTHTGNAMSAVQVSCATLWHSRPALLGHSDPLQQQVCSDMSAGPRIGAPTAVSADTEGVNDSTGVQSVSANPSRHPPDKGPRQGLWHSSYGTVPETGELQETVYIRPPKGYASDDPAVVYKLNKPLYGLKQAPRAWHEKLRTVLRAIGFSNSKADAALFILRSKGNPLFLLTYVDDLLLACKNTQLLAWVKQQITRQLDVHDMGEAHLFLGMEITRDRSARTLTLTQSHKTLELLKRWRMDQSKPADAPIQVSVPLTPGEGAPLSAEMHAQYQAVVGSLIYLSICTRPDIAYAVHKLTRAMASPTEPYWKGAMHLLRYLAGTVSMGLVYRPTAGPTGGPSTAVQCYHDADYGGDRGHRKSTTGWVYIIHGAAVAWSSKLQPLVTLSTTESEYLATAAAMREGLWLMKLYSELTGTAQQIQLWGDNQPSIATLKNELVDQRTKHIDIQYHFVHERLSRGEFTLDYCSTEKMVADMLTKALSGRLLATHRASMGMFAYSR
jgi:hypothetical protein